LHKVGLANPMPGFLVLNPVSEQRGEIFVGAAAPQQRLEVVFIEAEEAGSQFSVGREAQPIAVTAEGLTHRSNDAQLALRPFQTPTARRF
jgi:hypothetical protein